MKALCQPAISDNAKKVLRARYLWKDNRGRITESPRDMYLRVAQVVASAETRYDAPPTEVEHIAEAFYEAMATGQFLPNSPTLMNAGRPLGLLSACFVLPIGDSVDEIFESVKHTAQIQRAGGGTGFSFDRLRPTGDYIASSGGHSSGPISFWRVFCEATRAIQQGAFRRGANMGMMSVEHPDILKFIAAKSDLVAFENFNISVKVSDEFMHALREQGDGPHVVVNPHTGLRYCLPRSLDIARYSLADLTPLCDGLPQSASHYSRRDVWEMIVRGAWATGEPGLCFIDRVNEDNPTPHVGRIEATNPCGEQPLLDYEACNLGSIDVSKFIVRHDERAELNEQALGGMVRLAVRFLDDVIDVNNYVIPEIADICRANRKIGLSVMGLADAMFEMGIRYDSDEGLSLGRRVAHVLTTEAFAASEELARRRGNFPNWPDSIWESCGRSMRNAAVTTVAPTGTLSILAGCSGGIEPAFALAFYRHILGGQEMLEVNGPFQRYAQRNGFWSERLARDLATGKSLRDMDVDQRTKDIFVTAHDIAPSSHLRMQAAFQEYIDGAISKTINLPNAATAADVAGVYDLAFDLGVKGVTVYRDGCRTGQPMLTQPARPGTAANDAAVAPDEPEGEFQTVCPQCRTPLTEDDGCSRCPRCGATLCSL